MNIAGAIAILILVALLWVALAKAIPEWLADLDRQDDFR